MSVNTDPPPAPTENGREGERRNDGARTCRQKNCDEAATHRYTWPGQDETVACARHEQMARTIAAGLGLRLQTIPL